MNKQEFIRKIIQKKKIDKEIYDLSMDIDDFPNAREILKRFEKSIHLEAFLNASNEQKAIIKKRDLYHKIIDQIKDSHLRRSSMQFLEDLLVLKVQDFKRKPFEESQSIVLKNKKNKKGNFLHKFSKILNRKKENTNLVTNLSDKLQDPIEKKKLPIVIVDKKYLETENNNIIIDPWLNSNNEEYKNKTYYLWNIEKKYSGLNLLDLDNPPTIPPKINGPQLSINYSTNEVLKYIKNSKDRFKRELTSYIEKEKGNFETFEEKAKNDVRNLSNNFNFIKKELKTSSSEFKQPSDENQNLKSQKDIFNPSKVISALTITGDDETIQHKKLVQSIDNYYKGKENPYSQYEKNSLPFLIKKFDKIIKNANEITNKNNKIATKNLSSNIKERAYEYFLSGKYKEAINDFNLLINSNPNEADYFYHKGRSYTLLLKDEEAIKNYDQAIKLNPHNAEYFYQRGFCLTLLDKQEEAFKDFDQAIKFSPNNANYHYAKGLAYYHFKNNEEALKYFDQAIKLNPYISAYFNFRGKILCDCRNEYEKALKDFKKAVELDPNEADYYFEKGLAYYYLEKYKEALKDFSKAIKLNPKEAKYFYQKGYSYYLLNKNKEAIKEFHQAIKLDPNNDQFIYNRGLAYYYLENYENALFDLNKAIKLNPKKAQYFYFRGVTSLKFNQNQFAIRDFNKAIKLNPNEADYYFEKGLAYYYLENYKNAIKEFHQAIKLDPNNVDYVYNKGLAYYNLENFENALKIFDKAIELNPEKSHIWEFRGRSKYFLDQYEEAIKDLDKAIELNPEDSYSWNFRGRSKYFLEKYEEAIKDLDKTIELNPEDSYSWYFRGRSKYYLDQYEEAIKDLDKAIELNPEDSFSWEYRGFAYLENLNFELAENDFKKSYEIDGDKANFSDHIGQIFYRKKDYYIAIKHYLDALKIEPNKYVVYANMSLAKYELSNHIDSYDDMKKSEELYNKQNKLEFYSIFDSKELNKVLKIYESNNDLERLEKILDYMNKNNKDNRNLLLVGILQFKKGDFYNAISTFIDVYKDDNQNKECILYLGKAKMSLEDYKNALIDLQKYKELESNDEVDKLIKTCEKNLNSN